MDMMEMYEDEDEDEDIAGFFPYYSETYEDTSSVLLIIAVVFGIFIFLFFLLFLFNTVRHKFRLYKLINLPAKESILHFYYYFVSVLDMRGYGFKSAETPFQYSARIDTLIYFSPVKFQSITYTFVKSRYSAKEATDTEKQQLIDFHSGFLDGIKDNMGKMKYFIYKYILGKF